ncbi:MAG: hypothetical protein OEM98_16150 [Gammaproteobacteria bacterium]|nr:hypothetical protein [Gammaproteobacteria bacterium]
MSATIANHRCNTTLYCGQGQGWVDFCRDGLGLDTAFENDRFVEFVLNFARV